MLQTPTLSGTRCFTLHFCAWTCTFRNQMHYTFALIALLCISGATWAQISIPNTSFTYNENFNTLPISGTGHTAVPAGWAFFETSVNFGTNTTYRAGDASGHGMM